MVAHVATLAFQGIESLDIDVQVQLSSGIVAFTVVGLPDKAVGESRERVRAALLSLGLALPARRITVNLAPADILKEGSHYDLPIAVGLLVALGVLPADAVADFMILGELGLDGALLPVTGALPAALAAASRGKGLICPAACGSEAVWANEGTVLAPASLAALINHFRGTQVLSRPEARIQTDPGHQPDLRDVRGQVLARRALEVVAAGGHNLLMVGPPGAGKSMLAARLPGLLPPLSAAEALDVSILHSLAGLLNEGQIGRAHV